MKLLSYLAGGGSFSIIEPKWDNKQQEIFSEIHKQVEVCYTRALRDCGIQQGLKREMLHGSQASAVRDAMIKDVTWQSLLELIVINSFVYSGWYQAATLEKSAITIPWWNEVIGGFKLPFFISRDDKTCSSLPLITTCNEGIKIQPSSWEVTHSYVVMLMRSLTAFQGGVHPGIVGGLLVTSDGKVVIGERGGEYFSGCLSVIPGGSLSTTDITSGVGKELYEEISISPSDLQKDIRIVAIGEHADTRICVSSIIETKVHSKEIKERWHAAEDSWEHVNVECIPYNRKNFSASYVCDEYDKLTGRKIPFMPLAEGVLVTAAAALGSPEKLLGFFSNDAEIRQCL
jgi:hypothetical protein